MKIPSKPENESERLQVLRATELLDSHSEEAFDTLVRAVATLLRVPIALVSLVDDGRQWFKAKVGLDAAETSRSIAFCAHVVETGEPLVVSDATLDARFADNPMVTGPPFVRFYAGVPLAMPSREVVGTLCVIDRAPRTLARDQLDALENLAGQVLRLVELRVLNTMVQRSNERLREKNTALRRARAMLDAAPDTMLLVDRAGRCSELSSMIRLPWESAENGDAAGEGRMIDDVVPSAGQELLPVVVAAIDRGESGKIEKAIRRDGVLVVLEFIVAPCREGEALVVLRDVTRERELERMKHEFISMIAHELRTPLSSILASLKILGADVFGPLSTEQREMVSVSLQSSERLGRLVNDVLDLEKLSIGGAGVVRARVDLSELCADAIRELGSLAREAGVRLELETIAGFAAQADRDQLLQAIVNLLGNAVRFSPRDELVTLRVDAVGERVVRIAVRDRGPGIARDQHARLFRRFERLDRSKGGTGLGLAIAREIVAKHGGRIGVESEAGAGSTFWIELDGETPAREVLAARWRDEVVAEARAVFLGTLSDAKALCVASLEGVEAGASVDREALGRTAHRIAGTSGSLGMHELSASARVVEDLSGDARSVDPDALPAALRSLVMQLDVALSTR